MPRQRPAARAASGGPKPGIRREFFGKQDPIGHFIGYETATGDHTFQVVKVVGDAHVDGLRLPAPPVAYFSLEQGGSPAGTIEVSATGSPTNITADFAAA